MYLTQHQTKQGPRWALLILPVEVISGPEISSTLDSLTIYGKLIEVMRDTKSRK